MTTLFQIQESNSRVKKVAIAIAILTACGLAVWGGLEMALRLATGRS